MTQEEKELLLKDLSARLPYGVIMTNKVLTETYYPLDGNEYQQAYYDNDWDDVPYLRPMSSMTEEEENEYFDKWGVLGTDDFDNYKIVDWLNKKMFAYRTIDGKDMFELGIALRAPEGMYK